MTWELISRTSTAAQFHAEPIPDDPTPQIWLHQITRPAVVLGSTQRDDLLDLDACARVGAEVVRRRSGGGAVWLEPDSVVWCDVILPAGSPGWSDDIHRPMVWLGHHLAEAFAQVGATGAEVYDGAMISTKHSRTICFDGIGPGELLIGDAKLVGISQRRTRSAARLQCCWYIDHDPADLTGVLADGIDPSVLRPVATVPRAVAEAVPAALVAVLDAH